MRISDWSSDVCSSDLLHLEVRMFLAEGDDALGLGVEQPSPRPAKAIGGERLLELLALQQHGEPGQSPLRQGRGCQGIERRPDMLQSGRETCRARGWQ